MSHVTALHAPVRALVLFGTSTDWKIEELAAIARADNKGVVVKPLRYFGLFHSAVEDEDTALGNLKKKFNDVEITSDEFRRGGKNHVHFLNALRTNGLHFEGGADTAINRTYVLADDTTIAVPTDIWEKMLPVLRKHVVAGSLKASACAFDEEQGKNYVSVADIGPIMAAMGHKYFWRLVRDSAAKIPEYDNNPALIFNQVTCAITCLGMEKSSSFKRFTAHSPVQLYQPAFGEKLPLIPTSEDFVCRPGDSLRLISSDYANYLLTESPRKKIYDQVFRYISVNESRYSKTSDAASHFTHASQDVCVAPVDHAALKIVQPSEGNIFRNRIYKGKIKISVRSFLHAHHRHELSDAKSMHFSFGNAESAVEHPDAMIFAPFNVNDEAARLYNYSRLNDAFVAKALDPALTFAPIVVMNFNGCYSPMLEAHYACARDGKNKEFIRPAIFDDLTEGQHIISSDKVEHIRAQYCDILNSTDWDALDGAAFEVLRFRLNNYRRAELSECKSQTPFFKCGGEPRSSDRFAITVFASASSDAKADNDNAEAIGRYSREIDADVLTGGGDQHAMGSILVGCGKNEKTDDSKLHLTCVSTRDIVKVETMYGRLPPGSDYWELHEKIGPRIDTLLKGDLFVALSGGDGTMQEAFCVLAKKYAGDMEMINKPLIFVGNTAAIHAQIASAIGKENLDKLRENPYAMDYMGIYLVPSAYAAQPIIRSYYERFTAKRHTALDAAQNTNIPAPVPIL